MCIFLYSRRFSSCNSTDIRPVCDWSAAVFSNFPAQMTTNQGISIILRHQYDITGAGKEERYFVCGFNNCAVNAPCSNLFLCFMFF